MSPCMQRGLTDCRHVPKSPVKHLVFEIGGGKAAGGATPKPRKTMNTCYFGGRCLAGSCLPQECERFFVQEACFYDSGTDV